MERTKGENSYEEYGFLIFFNEKDEQVRQNLLELALEYECWVYGNYELKIKSRNKENIQRLREQIIKHKFDV